jgi:phospholipase/lecithinase/hemolysin
MTTIHWKHGASGPFETATNWSTNTVPGVNDDVIIGAPGTYTVTVSESHVIRSLRTASTATLAISRGTFSIVHGTGAGANAGAISVGNGAALKIGGLFDNSGQIELSSTGRTTNLIIGANVTLTGGGKVTLSAGGHNAIIATEPSVPIIGPTFTLINADNTIVGAGRIGSPHLAFVNAAMIIGNSAIAPLTVNTGEHHITNSGLMEGATAQGLVIAGNVANTGTLEALGPNARLLIEGTVTDAGRGNVRASGDGAHVDLDSAAITGGLLSIGSNALVRSHAGSGLSVISGAKVVGSGTLQANPRSTLSVTSSILATGVALMSNGNGAALSIDGTVGAVAGTISGGKIEFKGASAAAILFAPGQVGTLKLDSSFTGTVAGFAGHQPLTFTNFFAFGDSSIDSGSWQFLAPALGHPHLTARLQNARASGGTNAPVGVGLMNVQDLAADFGLTADTAYTTGGVVGGGGTNYAISGALSAADPGSGNDPGNGNLTNLDGPINPLLLSTVAQIETYLNSVGGAADPSALYFISSGINDATYAANQISNSVNRQAYISAQAHALASGIEKLSRAGAEHIIVNTLRGDGFLDRAFTQDLFAELDASGIPYIKSDVDAMSLDVTADPAKYGFRADGTTVHPGVPGPNTESALIEPDTNPMDNIGLGWGLWGANTTTPDTSPGPNEQYAYLCAPDAEETHFYADGRHLSAAGQRIWANLDYNLLADDAIDLAYLPYTPGATTASFAGDAFGGTLSVTNGTQTANIALLGNHMAAAFVTASDGLGGTLVMDQTNLTPQQPALAAAHGS